MALLFAFRSRSQIPDTITHILGACTLNSGNGVDSFIVLHAKAKSISMGLLVFRAGTVQVNMTVDSI